MNNDLSLLFSGGTFLIALLTFIVLLIKNIKK
ncbi:putative holin-like toxin [Clostridium butyricum]|nr:putative holin-like toxin [Clostridium butyricum]